MNPRIHELLQHAKTLRFYEDRLARVAGDRFNIFELLGVGRLEVGTHTPYLVEFLNPKGAHGLGSRPLASFVRRFELSLDSDTAVVKTNYYLGPKTESSGGYVDILLEDAIHNRVVIENKIDHEDEEKQLHRYRGSLPKAQIVYLTLKGRQPSDFSIQNKAGILCLSYARHIIDWQEECQREAANAPLVRETIAQYINLIKRLTGQSTNTHMTTQIVDAVVKDESSLAGYYELHDAERAVRARIIAALNTQCTEIAGQLGLKVKFDNELLDGKYNSIYFFDASMQEQHISIAFQFELPNYKDFFFGICYDNEDDSKLAPPGLLEAFKRVFGDGDSNSPHWWAVSSYWEARRDWDHKTFADILFLRFKPELVNKVEKLLAVVRTAQAIQREKIC